MLTAVAILACLTALVGLGLWMRERQRRHALESKLETTKEELDEVRREARNRIGRAEREAKRREKDATWEAIETLLPAIDALESALRQRREKAGQSGESSSESLGEGISLTLDQFETGLDTLGIERLTPSAGDAFDPDWHEALHIRESTESEANEPSENREGAWKVRECVRSGYRTDERVLRPAGVVVEQSAGREAASDEPARDDEVTLEGEPSDGDEQQEEASAKETAARKTQS